MTSKVDSHQFFEDVWCAIPKELISDKYIDENLEFIRVITFSYYREYEKDTISFDVSVRLIEKLISNLFRNKPENEDAYENH